MTTNNSINVPIPASVANGGIGDTSVTAYNVLCGGTTSTGGLQSIASVGTLGQILISNGAAALPTFQTGLGSGLIAQVISTPITSAFTSTATSYTAITGLTATITPSVNTHTVLIIVNITGAFLSTPGTIDTPGALQLVRGSTAICIGDTNSTDTRATGSLATFNTNQSSMFSMAFIDSPATTSATTYGVQFINGTGGGTFFMGETYNLSTSAYSVGVSSITLMEIVA